MSTFVPARLACPCGAFVEAQVADGLHISLRPDLRQSILDGTFHVFACGACGRTLRVEKVLAYSDFPRREWFTIVPERDLPFRHSWARFCDDTFRATMLERAAPLVRSWAPEMKRRLVFGLASLREKLLLSDEGIDDRAAEVVKWQLRHELRQFRPEAFCHFLRRSGSRQLTLGISRLDGSEGLDEVRVELDRLREAEAQGEEAWRAVLPELSDLVVDHRAALFEDRSHEPMDLPAAVPEPVMGEPDPPGRP